MIVQCNLIYKLHLVILFKVFVEVTTCKINIFDSIERNVHMYV